jgi:hypothetical protein
MNALVGNLKECAHEGVVRRMVAAEQVELYKSCINLNIIG